MSTSAALPVVRRKRGNPNWSAGRPVIVPPAQPTEFEMQVRELGLSPKTYAASPQLRNWCERNRNRLYIPEWLLKTWKIKVDISTAA